MPKLVFLTNGYMGVLDRLAQIPKPPGRLTAGIWHSMEPCDMILSTTPFFHLIGFIGAVVSICHKVPFLIMPDRPLATDFIIDTIKTTHPTAVVFPPSILKDLFGSDSGIQAISALKMVFFGGGPLAPDIGDQLSRLTTLTAGFGCTETSLLPTLLPKDKSDWGFIEFNPYFAVDMQCVAEGLYELVIPRGQNRDFHAVFHTFPELSEYRTKDLFTPHPSQPNLWRFQGRLDDVIVLNNSEKFNPVTMESIIENHPLVSKAMILGTGWFQAALLIQPNWALWEETKGTDSLINEIWDNVTKANGKAPAYGHILRDKILVASKEKPFSITVKGSIRRRDILGAYAQEIEAIYSSANGGEQLADLPADLSVSELERYLHRVISRLMPTVNLSESTDFFDQGFDSLRTIQLAGVLRSSLLGRYPTRNFHTLTPSKIYTNPTITELSQALVEIINGGSAGLQTNKVNNFESRSEKLASLVRKYTSDLPDITSKVERDDNLCTVLLTGSTGSLGTYILNTLASDPTIGRIYCLNRSDDSEARQRASFESKGLQLGEGIAAKMVFLRARLNEKYLGVESAVYNEMLHSVDAVIHSAWKVDFNVKVETFENFHIAGLRRLIDFCLDGTRHAQLHFVSSISSISGWKPEHGPVVPERPLEVGDISAEQGYGESKHVAERICLVASRRTGLHTSILRVGQVAGPSTPKGEWNRHEWLPTLVATSKVMGLIPTSLGSMSVDWIPVVSRIKQAPCDVVLE